MCTEIWPRRTVHSFESTSKKLSALQSLWPGWETRFKSKIPRECIKQRMGSLSLLSWYDEYIFFCNVRCCCNLKLNCCLISHVKLYSYHMGCIECIIRFSVSSILSVHLTLKIDVEKLRNCQTRLMLGMLRYVCLENARNVMICMFGALVVAPSYELILSHMFSNLVVPHRLR